MDAQHDPVIEAKSVALNGPRGAVIEPLDFTIYPGTLTLLLGHGGSGRTSLLLALTGRLKLSSNSSLTVLGYHLPKGLRHVREQSEIVGIQDLDELDEQVTIGATLRERLSLQSRAWTHIPRIHDDDVARYLAPVFGDREIPHAKDLVYELNELDNLLVRIALSLISEPKILALDDLDSLHENYDRKVLVEVLNRLTDQGVTVIASATSEDVLNLPLGSSHNVIILNNSREER
ncbi:ATP-binding cassette domain-containing protein [Arcanobacterium ihumii]|uniref:ATP-binding cassette domain-containing protein n=1 Tax=Arcanobacterium ihumii TaxID=2138162 RepID=UPI00135912E9|nr:ATP-binding cassette domain-containing protein [Arcanobacterium ihumii]